MMTWRTLNVASDSWNQHFPQSERCGPYSKESNMNEATGIVTEAGMTKTQKPKLKIGGSWYYIGRALNGSVPTIGMTIDLKYSLFGDKGDLRSLEAWKPASSAVPTSAIPQAAPVDEASLRFISNVVGSAIMSGACTDPVAVKTWFNAAKGALECKQVDRSEMYQPVTGVDDRPPDFDDEIGF